MEKHFNLKEKYFLVFLLFFLMLFCTGYSSQANGFPKEWKVFKGKDFVVYAPINSKIKEKNGEISIAYKNNWGKIFVTNRDISSIISSFNPSTIYQKGQNSYFFTSNNKLYSIVSKGTNPTLLTIVCANNYATLKALSISLSTFKPLKNGEGKINVKLVQWQPNDRSFTIDIPENWKATGGTADYGRNGYLRIVEVFRPDMNAGFLGIYYPFYQYAQTSYGSSGIYPMNVRDYITQRFFNDLYQNYRIQFQGLNIKEFNVNEKLSRQLTYEQERLKSYYGINGKIELKAFFGKASYSYQGQSYDMAILGVISYSTFPLQGMGYSYVWGPAPIFIEVAKRGKLADWLPVFKRMADSFRVSNSWLAYHQKNARIDASRTIQHYRRMSDMIHKNAERRMEMGMKQWQSEENEKMEEFWDSFYALGGEERYNNPETGEEIDVPIGADKYFYDKYSEQWMGVNNDNPNLNEIIENLKEKGFVQLKLHRH